MRYTKVENIYILKIEKGEEVIARLTSFCEEQNISNALFSGIGAVQGLSCGYYALDEKKYYFTQYDELVEVASLTGNVMLKEGKPYVHVHGVFTNTTNNAFGGHIQSMVAGVVVEISLQVLSSQIERTLDEEIGLYLMECGK